MKNCFKIKILAILIILMIVLSITTIVHGYSANISMDANNDFAAGNDITVTISLKDLVIGNGIDAFMGTINYDSNVFESLTIDSLVATNGWNPVFNPATNIFTIINNSKVSTESSVLAIKFKVKSSINTSSTDIKLTNMAASGGAEVDGGTGDINIQDKTLTLTAKAIVPTITVTKSYNESTNKVIATVTSNIKMTNSKVQAGWILSEDGLTYTKEFDKNSDYNETFDFVDGTVSTKSISVIEIKDSTIAKTNLPSTGIARNIIFIVITLSTAIIGMINYRKYKDLKIK